VCKAGLSFGYLTFSQEHIIRGGGGRFHNIRHLNNLIDCNYNVLYLVNCNDYNLSNYARGLIPWPVNGNLIFFNEIVCQKIVRKPCTFLGVY
jgi:hypothetical protein